MSAFIFKIIGGIFMSNILDLDKLVPEKREVVLAGEKIDVSKIPSRVTMEVAEKADLFSSGSAESFPELLEMIVKICKPSKEDITQDWIIDNTSMDQLIALIQFVLEPLQEKADEMTEGSPQGQDQQEVKGKNKQAPKAKTQK